MSTAAGSVLGTHQTDATTGVLRSPVAAVSFEVKEKRRGWAYATSAVASGLITKSTCAPFDRIRLLYQVQGMFNDKKETKYRSLTHTARTIIKEEGFTGLWRGNGANMLRAAFVYMLKFGTNDVIKDALRSRKIKRKATLSPASARREALVTGLPADKRTIELSIGSLMSAGLIAGTVQKISSYPLDLLSVRISLGVNVSSSILSAVKRIKATEGITGFYKGFGPTLLTGIPYVMLQMTFFELYSRRLRPFLKKSESGSPTWSEWFRVLFGSGAAGSLAGVTAQLMVFPGDTVRKRMMNNGVDGKKALYRDSLHCFRTVLYREGLPAFYHGVLPMCLRAIPSGAIQFGTYEFFKSVLAPKK